MRKDRVWARKSRSTAGVKNIHLCTRMPVCRSYVERAINPREMRFTHHPHTPRATSSSVTSDCVTCCLIFVGCIYRVVIFSLLWNVGFVRRSYKAS